MLKHPPRIQKIRELKKINQDETLKIPPPQNLKSLGDILVKFKKKPVQDEVLCSNYVPQIKPSNL